MGEAKRRGTFEQRRDAAIERNRKVQEEADRLFDIWKQKQAAKEPSKQ